MNEFPKEFGESPDDFLRRYESLIYKIILERTKGDPRFNVEDLFQEFFIHLAEDNFGRLRCFRKESLPTTYLGKILRNFIYDQQYRKKSAKVSEVSIEEIEEQSGEIMAISADLPDSKDVLASKHIQEALRETFSRLTNREKLIFDLFYNEGMSAKEIANHLGDDDKKDEDKKDEDKNDEDKKDEDKKDEDKKDENKKAKSVYKVIEKIKKILKRELGDQGIEDF